MPRLFNLEDEPLLAMHPCDMRHRNLESGDLVRVTNARGATTVRVAERPGLQRGRAWMPMHWGSSVRIGWRQRRRGDATDPYSMQPELKRTAVQIAKSRPVLPAGHRPLCASRSEALVMMQEARPRWLPFLMRRSALYGRSSPLVVFRASGGEGSRYTARSALDRLFVSTATVAPSSTRDASATSPRRLPSPGQVTRRAAGGETLAANWLKQAMAAEDNLDASLIRLAPSAKRQAAMTVAPRNIICKGADIPDSPGIHKGQRGAGGAPGKLEIRRTFCGSCVPDIKRLVARIPRPKRPRQPERGGRRPWNYAQYIRGNRSRRRGLARSFGGRCPPALPGHASMAACRIWNWATIPGLRQGESLAEMLGFLAATEGAMQAMHPPPGWSARSSADLQRGARGSQP